MSNTRPEFVRPPLAEQAITVIFDRISGFSLVDFGLAWSQFRGEFPEVLSQPMREPVIERFDGQVEQQILFKLMPDDTLPRAIFRSREGHEQVQIQPDQFTFNWLKVGDAEYPRSEKLVSRFVSLFDQFREFVGGRGLGEMKITHCELVNVNIVPVKAFGQDFGDASAFFHAPAPEVKLAGLRLESVQFQSQYVMHGAEDKPFGRLRQTLSPVLRIEDGEKAYRFELAARGRPDANDLSSALAFFEKGRDAINAAFVASTTTAAHNHWGLR